MFLSLTGNSYLGVRLSSTGYELAPFVVSSQSTQIENRIMLLPGKGIRGVFER